MHSMVSSVARSEETGFFESAGERVRYRVRGDGPPLLMVHGIGAPLELWQPLESKLGDFRTITVDPPGAGHSSTPQGRFGMREFAQVLDDLLTHLELESASVLGLSLGGMMAQELARRSPERVEKLVLASTSCGWTANPLTRVVLPTPGELRRRRRDRPIRYDQQIDQDPSLLKLQWDIRGEYTLSARGYLVQLRAALSWTSRPWLSELTMPVLAIAGSDDRVVPVVNSRIITANVQDGRLEMFPGGHLCLFKESIRTSQLIRAFLLDD